MPRPLTPKQRLFALEYLKDENGTRAAIAAGYAEKTARITASKLLTLANIQALISKKGTEIGKRLEKLEVSVERVKLELAKLAFVDPRNFFRADGSSGAARRAGQRRPVGS